jgi:hypothetical protein
MNNFCSRLIAILVFASTSFAETEERKKREGCLGIARATSTIVPLSGAVSGTIIYHHVET